MEKAKVHCLCLLGSASARIAADNEGLRVIPKGYTPFEPRPTWGLICKGEPLRRGIRSACDADSRNPAGAGILRPPLTNAGPSARPACRGGDRPAQRSGAFPRPPPPPPPPPPP